MRTICLTVFLFSIVMISCKKQDIISRDQSATIANGIPAAEKQSIAGKKDFRIMGFLRNGRTYDFYYNQNGDIDSVQAREGMLRYTYKVYYKGSHIDSVNLVMNGVIQSTNTNFSYKGKWITSYDYYQRVLNFSPIPVTHTFNYDNKNRITSICYGQFSPCEYSEQYVYNENNDVSDFTSSIGSLSATFTYDTKLNPVQFIPGAFAIFVEEGFLLLPGLSEHNSLTKTYSSGLVVNYNNQYDSMGRLVSRSFYDNNQNGQNTLTISYFD